MGTRGAFSPAQMVGSWVAEKRDLKNKTIALQSRVQAAEGPTILVGGFPSAVAVR